MDLKLFKWAQRWYSCHSGFNLSRGTVSMPSALRAC